MSRMKFKAVARAVGTGAASRWGSVSESTKMLPLLLYNTEKDD
jgi:hypothetical protein